MITTPLVIAEGHAWFLRRYDRTRALQFLSMTEAMTPLRIATVGEKEQRGAAGVLRKFADQDLTMADALGLFLMRDRTVSRCWSTDFHLGLTGVRLVINER